MAIYFYSKIGEYGEFSNFSPHGVEMDDGYWRTVEHYFQAQKFADADYKEKIRNATTPKQAKSLGRSRALPIRTDWEVVKEGIMKAALRKKFTTHPELKTLLLETGEEELIEDAPTDYYWGCGRTRTGKNRLGALLMEVRAELRAETDSARQENSVVAAK
jgi:N-glycosidase YbiA